MQNCRSKIFLIIQSKMMAVIFFIAILLPILSADAQNGEHAEKSHFPKANLISPCPGKIAKMQKLIILISLFDADDDINPASVILKIDGINKSDSARISRTLISFAPTTPFKAGRHEISITVSDSSKNKTGPIIWHFFSFQKPAPPKKSSAFRGTISLQSNFNFFSNEKPAYYRPNDTQRLQLSVNQKMHGWYFAFSTTQRTHLDQRDRLIDERFQSFNRYQFYLSKNKFLLQIGDFVPDFSALTVCNNRVRGISLIWHYKALSTKLIQGQLYRAVVSSNLSQLPAFSRNVFAAEIGFRFFSNFKIMANLIKFKEKSKSSIPGDSDLYHFYPTENLVISTRLEYLAANRKTEFSAEAAHSIFIYNTDCHNQKALFRGLKKHIPAWLIKINDCYITTFSRTPAQNLAPRTYQLQLRRQFKFATFSVKFSRIPQSFNTLGNQNLPYNSQQIEISSRSNLYANRLFLALKYFNGKNDLMPHPSTPETERKRFQFSINYAVSRFLSLWAGLQKFSQMMTGKLSNSQFDLWRLAATLQFNNAHQLYFNYLQSASKVQSEHVTDFQSLAISSQHRFFDTLTLGLGFNRTNNKLQENLSYNYTDIHGDLRYKLFSPFWQLFFSGDINKMSAAQGKRFQQHYFSAGCSLQLQEGFSLIGKINYFTSKSPYSMTQFDLEIQGTF